MKLSKVLLVFLLMVSCSPIYVNFDYEKQIDFKTYTTYNYYSNLNTGLSELDNKRLLKIFDDGMLKKGFSLSETPDFFVNITSNEFKESSRNSVGVGVGGGGRNVGGGISIGIPVGNNKINQQLVIEFVDENKMGLIWHAISEYSFNPKTSPEQRESQLKAVVDKVLKGFPPKQ